MTAMTTTRTYSCGDCGRKLKKDHWVFSSWTKARYCYPGEGCWIAPRRKRKES